MSTAAPTIPGRRPDYTNVSRRVIVPHRTKEYPGKPRQKDEIQKTAALDRIKGDIHRNWGKGEGFSYMFTGTEETKPWQPTGSRGGNKQVPPVSNQLVLRPLAEQQTTKNDRIEKIHEGAKMKKAAYQRFMNKKLAQTTERRSVHAEGDSNVPTSKGVITATKDYDAILEERLEMLEMHNSFKKRIKTLEIENADMLKNFTNLTKENEELRKKLGSDSPEPLIESYQRVFEDRKMLRKAEDGYKSRIRVLEYELKEKQDDCVKQTEEFARLRTKDAGSNAGEKQIPKIRMLETECTRLKAENNKLKEEVKIFKIKESKAKRTEETKHAESSPRRWKKPEVTVLTQTKNQCDVTDRGASETVPLGQYTARSSNNKQGAGQDKIAYSYKYSELNDLKNMLPDIY